MFVIWAAAGTAEAATCSFDPGTATATVVAGIGTTTKLLAVKVSGEIRVNGLACGSATVTNTDTILVRGGDRAAEIVTITGSFAPGLTPEADGASEIEISVDLGGETDWLTVYLGSGNNKLTLTASGLDVGNDGDEDITTAGADAVVIDGEGGNDNIDASAYTATPFGGRLNLVGGPGDDRLVGSEMANRLWGDDGDDLLYGLGGPDKLYGGPGNDSLYGGAGPDQLIADAGLDGADTLRGGDDDDRVDYSARTNPLDLTLGNGLADDGEAGEGDSIEADVENAFGGAGNDVLVGSSRRNFLDGRGGDDEIYGGASNDYLIGGAGNDSIFGDDGNDTLTGGDGNDTLTGGAGADYLAADIGDDLIFNADGFADEVLCGAGTDDAEPDPLDYFNACEL
jgi:Ca2+-binding RTX toxin-like protein